MLKFIYFYLSSVKNEKFQISPNSDLVFMLLKDSGLI